MSGSGDDFELRVPQKEKTKSKKDTIQMEVKITSFERFFNTRPYRLQQGQIMREREAARNAEFKNRSADY